MVTHISHQQEEIEGLIRENEELKTKNQSLESQLKTVLDPSSMNAVQTDDKTVDPLVLEEWSNKLRAATDVCEKIKQDMDKLKEVYTLILKLWLSWAMFCKRQKINVIKPSSRLTIFYIRPGLTLHKVKLIA